jgi:hypothetical protein
MIESVFAQMKYTPAWTASNAKDAAPSARNGD